MTTEPSCLPPTFEEPLALSAPLARAWAARHCARAPGGGCDHYHGFWQHLRLMGLGATLGGHPQRYLRALSELARRWAGTGGDMAARRVLVSGTADYSMLAHVAAAFHAGAGAMPQLHVLDLCPTPLLLNEWYARRTGLVVETVCADLLAHEAPQGYDLVVTSSLLGYFSPAQRPALFTRLAALLRPGGCLMFSNRLRPGLPAQPLAQTETALQRLADAVAARAPGLPPQAALDTGTALDAARAYAGHRRPYPLDGADTLRALAQGAGLQWLQCEAVGGDAAAAPGTPGGPTLADGSPYVFVTLGRPAA